MPASQRMFGGMLGAFSAFGRNKDKKGSAEATGRAEGEDSGTVSQKKAAMFSQGRKEGGLRPAIERIVDEKMSGQTEKAGETDTKVLKTPKNDATTKELTTSSKDASIAEGVNRLYKQ
tara:strand:+ start:92 stop:445 length:354 start_codon:yes stop_codon:yes gene_type:complete